MQMISNPRFHGGIRTGAFPASCANWLGIPKGFISERATGLTNHGFLMQIFTFQYPLFLFFLFPTHTTPPLQIHLLRRARPRVRRNQLVDGLFGRLPATLGHGEIVNQCIDLNEVDGAVVVRGLEDHMDAVTLLMQ